MTILSIINYMICIITYLLSVSMCQTRGTGLVVVRDQRVVGLHCSGPELHVGQVAVIRHGPRLAASDLYFSRRPCATCLKMLINGEIYIYTAQKNKRNTKITHPRSE